MQPKVSVIIPAYNTAAKIEATLQSIIRQNYENIEIIVVDDASSDNTAGAARNILQTTSRPWQLITHEINRGVSAARNSGMNASTGDFLWFVDSDDYADVDFASTMVAIAKRGNCDLVFCGYRTIDELNGSENTYRLPKSDDPSEMLRKFLLYEINPYMWATLFNRDFITSIGLFFTEGCTYTQDREFLVKALTRAEQIDFSDEYLYTYRLHGRNTTRRFNESFEKLIRSSRDRDQAQIRAAKYVVEYARSSEVRCIAKYYVLPKFYLKQFNIYAWEDDRGSTLKYRRVF